MSPEVDRIVTRDGLTNYALETEQSYNVFCFAQDDWPLQVRSDAASAFLECAKPCHAPSLAVLVLAGNACLGAVAKLRGSRGRDENFLIGCRSLFQSDWQHHNAGRDTSQLYLAAHRGLDAELFSRAEHVVARSSAVTQDPTASNDRIVITLQLNEPGTAYCRAARSDSGEAPSDMHINRILTANWPAQNDGLSNSTVQITQLENVDPLSTSRDDEVEPIAEAVQYDVQFDSNYATHH